MSFVEDLIDICADFSGTDYFVDELIPGKKLNNARDFFPIPGKTKVIALIDCTVFGSNKTGLAICGDGIYWRNDWSTETLNNYLAWDEFKSVVIKREGRYCIELGTGNILSLSGSAFSQTVTVNLLQAIQAYTREQLNPFDEETNRAGNNSSPTPSPSASPQSETWMLHIDGQQFGPYDKTTIKQMLMAGNINPTEAYVWKAGMNEWKPFSEVPSLASLFAPPSPPPIWRQKPNTVPEPTSSNSTNQTKLFDINNCTMEELLGLPGINMAEAQTIMRERANRNGFTNVDEMGRLLQLQPHIIEKLREMVAFNTAKLDINNASEEKIAELPGVGPILAKKAIALRRSQEGFASVEAFVEALGLRSEFADRIKLIAFTGPVTKLYNPISTGRLVDY